jgi:acetylornithine deacetylase/succinyl-diaminopimelate desuccinylase-like protein
MVQASGVRYLEANNMLAINCRPRRLGLAHTPREELSREEIDGLCQLAYELLNKLTKTQEVFREARQKLRLP